MKRTSGKKLQLERNTISAMNLATVTAGVPLSDAYNCSSSAIPPSKAVTFCANCNMTSYQGNC